MPEKPKFVIIGETHPSGIETDLRLKGKLRLKVSEKDGRVRIDNTQEGNTNQKSIAKIKKILDREVEILKKEGIVLLFVEEPAEKFRKESYSRFQQTGDLKRVQSELRKAEVLATEKLCKGGREFISRLDLPDSTKEMFVILLKKAALKKSHVIFQLSSITVAHKAGITDIRPMENERYTTENYYYIMLLASLPIIMEQYLKGDPKNKKVLIFIQKTREAIESKLLEINSKREQAISETVIKEYVPGSAILCGKNHVKPLKKLLSERFKIKTYKTK